MVLLLVFGQIDRLIDPAPLDEQAKTIAIPPKQFYDVASTPMCPRNTNMCPEKGFY
jgi:hypothetical protein